MRDTQEFQAQIGRIEELVHRVESTADPALRGIVTELVEDLMAIHGAGLQRIIELVSSSGGGSELIQSLASDELVSSLLVLYGLHPEDFETRVRRGLDKVRPALRSQGARLDSIAISEGAVRIKIAGSASKQAEEAVRNALLETAPDAADVVIDASSREAASAFVPLHSLRAANGSPAAVVSVTQP